MLGAFLRRDAWVTATAHIATTTGFASWGLMVPTIVCVRTLRPTPPEPSTTTKATNSLVLG
jgi:hypothetical protein